MSHFEVGEHRHEVAPPVTPPPQQTVIRRPWGTFEQFVTNQCSVTVKIITVKAGARLSLQKHEHRDELWKILDHALEIHVDGQKWTAQPGDVVWAPRGATHRISNFGQTAARVLEIALGPFDEDDIERLADDYSRVETSYA